MVRPPTIVALLALFALPFVGEAAQLVVGGRGAMAEVTLAGGLAEPGARPGRDGPPAGLCAAVGAWSACSW